MNAYIAKFHITRTIEALEAAGSHDDARLVGLDLMRAGEDLRELLMVRDDALDMLERTAEDDDNDHPSLTAAERNPSLK
jgi:hypothetical protein